MSPHSGLCGLLVLATTGFTRGWLQHAVPLGLLPPKDDLVSGFFVAGFC